MASSGGLAAGEDPRRLVREAGISAASRDDADLDDADRHRIARTVEGEVIPRLLLLHRSANDCGPDVPPSTADVARFARLLLSDGSHAAGDFVVALQAKGASVETLFLQLFAPAARVLGDLWLEDLASFAEVTIGLSRLQRLLRDLRDSFEQSGESPWNGRRVLLAPAPGEQHSFGLSVVETFLRRGGWHVEALWGAGEREVVKAARTRAFDLVGFSLSSDVLLDRLTATIEAVRRTSLNRAIKVMVGGRYFAACPDRAATVGADACAVDAKGAAATAVRLIGREAWAG